MRLRVFGLVVGMLVASCSHPVDFYCDETTSCLPRYPDRPFCDLTGEYGGVARTCIANPIDGGVDVDAPVNDVDAGTDANLGPDAQSNGSIVVTKDGTGTGLVVSTPGGINCGSSCQADFPLGNAVMLTATPDMSSDFIGWSGAGCSGTAPCDVQPGDTVGATFNLKQEDLTISPSGDGTGSVTATGIDCPSDCTQTYDYGTMITLTATASGASSFGGWSGDGCSGTSSTCMVTMDQARAIGAAFDLNSFSLSVGLNGTGGGSVTSSVGSISCPGSCSDSYTANTMVTLTATPDGTSTFDGWTGDCTGPTCTVTMSAAHSVTANFTRITYKLDVGKTGSGSGLVISTPAGITCGTNCSQSYTKGTSVVLTESPDPGSTFIGWTGGGCTGRATTCTVSMTQARSVSAEFCAPVSDGVACTDDSCAADGTTQHKTNDLFCQDSSWCDGLEYCDAVNDCQSGTAFKCPVDDRCTTYSTCDESTHDCPATAVSYNLTSQIDSASVQPFTLECSQTKLVLTQPNACGGYTFTYYCEMDASGALYAHVTGGGSKGTTCGVEQDSMKATSGCTSTTAASHTITCCFQ